MERVPALGNLLNQAGICRFDKPNLGGAKLIWLWFRISRKQSRDDATELLE